MAIVAVAPYQMQSYDSVVTSFYAENVPSKLKRAVDLFIEKPYGLEPLGEGQGALYSEEPLYRTDQFDCVTYVDTVLALTASDTIDTFNRNMLLVRYQGGQVDFINRTEWFTDLEWLPNARGLGWIKNVTPTIINASGKPIAKLATTIIDKPNFYRVRPLQAMHRLPPVPNGQAALDLQAQLQALSTQFKPQQSSLDYLPLDKLFNATGEANNFLFDQIPSGSVVAIVRPDWPIRDKFPGFPKGYGTNLNVSHIGIVLRVGGELQFYNASSLQGKVVRQPLIPYLKKYLRSETIKGIHVERIVI